MTYYHESKDAALQSGAAYANDWELAAELEPYNGWVLILRPRRLDALKGDLFELLQIGELEFPKRLRRRPAEHKKAPVGVKPVHKQQDKPIVDRTGEKIKLPWEK